MQRPRRKASRDPMSRRGRIPDFTIAEWQGLNTEIKDLTVLAPGASPDSLNWITGRYKDHIELRGGYALLGQTRAGTGRVSGLGVGIRYDGVQVPFFTFGRKLKYYDVTSNDTIESGSDLLPAAASSDDATISPYQNIAGSFIYVSSPNSSVYKVPAANPGSPVDQLSTTYRGWMKIGQSRSFLWNRKDNFGGKDQTGLYLSYIDKTLLSNYTQITGEAVGTAGTLAFKGAGAKRTCIYLVVTATANSEVITDDRNGNLVGTLGSTGTIDYATGIYSITYVAGTTGTATYYWEDSTSTGILDFSFSGTRTAGQGNSFRQDDGGGNLQAVFPFGNDEFCFHTVKIWDLNIPVADTGSTNLQYRVGLGIPYLRSAFSTEDGIIFIDNSNPSKPRFRALQYDKSLQILTVVPVSLSDVLDLSSFGFDQAVVFRWTDYDILICKKYTNGVVDAANDVMFIRNRFSNVWDKVDYGPSCLEIYGGGLIAGDSVTGNLLSLFSGFDDDGAIIQNFWNSGQMNMGVSGIKRFYRLVLRGLIQRSQKIKVSLSYDGGAFVEVGGSDEQVVSVAAFDTLTLIDTYNESNRSTDSTLQANSANPRTGVAQSFTASATSTLYSAKFYLKSNGSPTGSMYAELYAHSGTYGSTSIPSGSPLATSAVIDASTLTGASTLYEFLFTGANAAALVSGTKYCIALRYLSGDSSNSVLVAIDTTSSSHDGNESLFNPGTGAWAKTATQDVCFYVYANVTTPATYTTVHHPVIEGNGSYVNQGKATTVGSPTCGSKVVGGGGNTLTAYPFELDIPIASDIFEYVQIRFEAIDVGYAQMDKATFKDIRYKGRKILPSQTL